MIRKFELTLCSSLPPPPPSVLDVWKTYPADTLTGCGWKWQPALKEPSPARRLDMGVGTSGLKSQHELGVARRKGPSKVVQPAET